MDRICLQREVHLPGTPDEPLPLEPDYSRRYRQPARFGFGAGVRLASRWRVRAEMLQMAWSALHDRYVDQAEWSVGASLDVTPHALLSLSYYRAGRDFMIWSNVPLERPGSLTAQYLALGSRLRFGRVQVDAAVADSRLLSSDVAGRTVVQVGASVAW